MILTRISQFIKDNGVTSYVYHTWRELEDEKGQREGEIRVLVLSDNVAHVEYQCPKCRCVAYEEMPWKRPFSTKCKECGATIRVPKLRDQIKKRDK